MDDKYFLEDKYMPKDMLDMQKDFKPFSCNCALPALCGDTKCCEYCLNNPNRKQNNDYQIVQLGTGTYPTIVVPEPSEEQKKKLKELLEKQSPVLDMSTMTVETIFPMYQMIADEREIKWFFENVIERPQVNESYSAVFVSRHKKLTKEEQEEFGLTRKEAEFLSTVTFKLKNIKDAQSKDDSDLWSFDRFLQRLKHFNVDKGAYLTSKGLPIPEKTLAVIFYVNPGDDMKVCRKFVEEYNDVNEAISKAMLGGKSTENNYQSYQWFGNAESTIKHLKANQKGSKYWMDFDIDVPKWWKAGYREIHLPKIDEHTIGPAKPDFFDDTRKIVDYYEEMKSRLDFYFGKRNYVIVDTSGGYHVLVRVNSIKGDPHRFCRDMSSLYMYAIFCGEQPYLDEKGNCKFECVVNDSQIPGLPLPGTYQYGRPVTVLNKDDFTSAIDTMLNWKYEPKETDKELSTAEKDLIKKTKF